MLSVFWILFVGFSRIWLGVHSPSDVIGAYILGLCLLSVYNLKRWGIMKSKLKPFDTVLFITILMLLGVGIIMILSASSHLGDLSYGSPYYFFIRQIIWSLIGTALMLFVSRI